MSSAFRRACLLTAVVFIATSCGSWRQANVIARLEEEGTFDVAAARLAFCQNNGNGYPARESPIVCVGKSDITGDIFARPEPVEAWRKHNGKVVKIRWLTVSPSAQLDVRFTDPGCVNPTTKHRWGNDHVEVSTNDATTGRKSCKYEIELDGQVWDPLIIIDDQP